MPLSSSSLHEADRRPNHFFLLSRQPSLLRRRRPRRLRPFYTGNVGRLRGSRPSLPAISHPSTLPSSSSSSQNRRLYTSHFRRRVSKVTLRFWSVTVSVVGANSPLFGWICLDVELNNDFTYSSGKGFLTTGPQTGT
ncbi:hypothetical protein E5676_scaffold306G003420 [Cucumis melo var. makuwa]|uniref:Uncharacterized protein n=1 Tax=Cucumis melo var. makuwa TaxID=1194695 RepID=A0A5D3D1E9_CUCMM|nr:hypothetical protein E5676_scaffold306G003420 [Cucumis melo var. makuwa]